MKVISEPKLATICSNVKAKGITIYTISFKVNDTATIEILRNCATSKDYYFPAEDSTALANAFQKISSNLTQMKLVE